AVEAEGGPFVQRYGAERAVETDAGGVPVQHRPFQPSQSPRDALLREAREQLPAEAVPAEARADEEVFEVDPVDAAPGREVQEPEGAPGRLAVDEGHVPEQRRRRAEE